MTSMHAMSCEENTLGLLFSLEYNKISNEGARALGDALKVNTTLKSLK